MSSSESVEQTYKPYISEPPITSSVETFFANYASIPSSLLREHLITVRERAWNKFNYPCLGRWSFLDFSIQQSSIYEEIVNKCKTEGATVIDFGCCLGQDVRKLIYDGVSIDQIRGYELDPFFIEQGYELFQDGEIMKKKKIFNSNDIFDDQFLENVKPADYVYVGSFIHLFDAEKQKDVCRRLTHLSKNAITGRQVGSLVPEERSNRLESTERKMMWHSPESFSQMWNEVTNGKWKVESVTLNKINNGEQIRQLLYFVVRKTIQE
jgi:hypothetical protein